MLLWLRIDSGTMYMCVLAIWYLLSLLQIGLYSVFLKMIEIWKDKCGFNWKVVKTLIVPFYQYSSFFFDWICILEEKKSFKLHWLFMDLVLIDFQEPHPLLKSNICLAYQRRRSCLTDRRHKLTRPAPSWLPWLRAGSRTPVSKHSWQSWTNISSITISSPWTFHPITP